MADSRATDAEDAPSTTVAALSMHLSDAEREMLDLYDQLRELTLEIALLAAHGADVSVAIDQAVSDGDIHAAESDLLHAKASYTLRNNIIDSILSADPVLKAVHAGANATPVQRDLLPFVRARDDASVSLTVSSKEANALREELTRMEAERIGVDARNRELTGTLMGLVEELGAQKKEDVQDEKVRAQLESLEAEMAVSRQRWRIIKGTISGVVAGSGVDWARDEDLRGLVLDDEEEDD